MKTPLAALALLALLPACAQGAGTSAVERDDACRACQERQARPDPVADAGAGAEDADCAAAGECVADDETANGCAEDVRYPADRTHSPLSCAVVENLRAIASRDRSLLDDSFMKVGDSISATHEFLHCFETDPQLDLAATGHGSLEPTRQHFLARQIQGTSPFARMSESARVGMTARWALDGAPPPVARERDTMTPRYAFVMFGTNDVQYGGPTASVDVKYEFMASHMRNLLDWHSERGIIPVLYSIPPYDGEYAAIRQVVPTYNALLRALAEHRRLPFVNYHREMKDLPNEGLRDDGVHPSADYIRLCNFDEAGLSLGYNLRNLLTLEALDRVWRVTREEDPAAALDARSGPPLAGAGSAAAPFLVDALPFGDMKRPSEGGQAATLTGACSNGPGEVRRLKYRLDLAEETPLRIVAIGFSGARVGLVTAAGTAPTCPQKTALIEETFPAGTFEITLDVVRPEGGEAALVIDRCEPADGRCR